MSITKDNILRLCESLETYKRGVAYYEGNKIKKFNLNKIDSSEEYITAKVKGSSVYNPTVWIENDEITKCLCDCGAFHKYDGICKHLVAVILKYYEEVHRDENISVRTTPYVMKIINSYTAKGLSNSETLKNFQKVSIQPRLKIEDNTIKVDFKLGFKRKYVIKDVCEFYRAIKNCETLKYGRDLEFVHAINIFDERSKRIVEFICNKVEDSLTFNKVYNKYSYLSSLKQRDLILTPKGVDEFFELFNGEAVEVLYSYNISEKLKLVDDNPYIAVTISKHGVDGAKLSIDNMEIITGEKHCYVCRDGKMYRCDKRFTESSATFLKVNSERFKDEMTINNKDLMSFCAFVLPEISGFLDIKSEDINLDEFSPPEAVAKFYIDMPDRNVVVCHPEIVYGDVKANVFERVQMRSSYRDVAFEYNIKSCLQTYFRYIDENENNTKIIDDEEALFNFIENGLPRLSELGEVFVSEKFERIKTVVYPKFSVGVSIESNLLNIELSSEDFDFKELSSLLQSYKLRKRYHRLKNGDFLKIEDNSISAVSEIIDGLNIPADDIVGNSIIVPKHRALYLDSVLRSSEGITFHRDTHFRSLVRNIRSVEDSDFEVPQTLRKVLRKYQRTGFRWLKTMDLYGFGGILADDMGLGKTIQVIALLLSQKVEQKEHNTSLIVCPASLIYNWESEIKKFAPQLRTAVTSNSFDERRESIKKYSDYDVLITSYDLLKRDIEEYKNAYFRYQIVDEAQYIKNQSTQSAKAVKSINSTTKFALTGTPIENRLSELWSIFDFLMPGFLYNYNKFKEEFEIPIVRDEDSVSLGRLRKMISPFILRRIKSNVLKDLPKKLENVVYAKMEGEQKKLYAANVHKMIKILKKQSQSEFNTGKIAHLAELTRIRQVCCDPSLCFQNYKGESAKLATCLSLISDAIDGGHKILVFSQFTSMLEILEERLRREKIEFYSLTGSTSKEKRISLVNNFNSNDVPVFLISLKAGGTGLNLTSADIVIHYDPWWNVATQNQATDRTHRIGQNNIVTVYKLIAKDTIEEKILKLQDSKKDLADSVISGSGVSVAGFTKEELIEILC